MMLTPAGAELATRDRALEHSSVEDSSHSDALLDDGIPMALRVRVRFARPLCRNGKCEHSDHYHHRLIGGILGDRWACDICSVEGGRCR